MRFKKGVRGNMLENEKNKKEVAKKKTEEKKLENWLKGVD